KKMVRPNRRKGIEEVYGSKMDAIHPAKSLVVSQVGMTKTASMRAERAAAAASGVTVGGAGGSNGTGVGGGPISNRQGEPRTQRSFITENDYYITTNLPIPPAGLRNVPNQMIQQTPPQLIPGHAHPHAHAHNHPSPYIANSSRRISMANKPSARQSQTSKVPHFSLPDNKVNNSVFNLAKPKDSHRMHSHGKPQASQRASFALEDMDFSDKELMAPPSSNQGNNSRRHVHQIQLQPHHPLQHQLHQQQMPHHSHVKPQQHQHHQQHQQHQQQLHHLHHQLHQPNQQQPHHPHPHQKHSRGRQPNPSGKLHVSTADDDDEKDDDPEEFFELIRQTVQAAVGNTISDALVKNFRDLGHKIDRFSGELKQTNEHLDKLQEHITSKVIYYGEENSRHFRYLCMKSEYDKMFYQHQSMMSGKPTPEMVNNSQANLSAMATATNTLGYKPSQTKQSSGKIGKGHVKAAGNMSKKDTMESIKVAPFHSSSKSHHSQVVQQAQPSSTDPHKSASDQSLTCKSSEMGMREVLGHIQRFCNQWQINDLGTQMPNDVLPTLDDILVPKKISNSTLCDSSTKPVNRTIIDSEKREDEDTEVDTPVDSMDETYNDMDEFQISSEISSCSEDEDTMKYGAGDMTTRAPVKTMRRLANKGAGDGQ
ncbi:hypothetical protein KR018_000250, partial [Drosophila ironensis]